MKKTSEKATAVKLVSDDNVKNKVESFIGGAEKTEEEINQDLIDRVELERVRDKKEKEKLKRQAKDENSRYYSAVSIRFSKGEIDRLDDLKAKKGITRLALIRLAIAEYIEKEVGS